jgi:hypothetical protein
MTTAAETSLAGIAPPPRITYHFVLSYVVLNDRGDSQHSYASGTVAVAPGTPGGRYSTASWNG